MAIKTTEYHSGAGIILLAERDTNGDPKSFFRIGDAGSFQLSFNVTIEEEIEDQTGDRLTAVRLQTAKSAGISVEAKSWETNNLARVVYGAASQVAAATGETYTFPTVADGEEWSLPDVGVTVTQIVDSAGTPVTLPTANYNVNSRGGLVEFLDVAGFTQPFVATFDRDGYDAIPFFTDEGKEYWCRSIVRNTVPSGGYVITDLYRTVLDPAATMDIISRGVSKFPISGSVLRDATKEGDASLGQFGRILKVAA